MINEPATKNFARRLYGFLPASLGVGVLCALLYLHVTCYPLINHIQQTARATHSQGLTNLATSIINSSKESGKPSIPPKHESNYTHMGWLQKHRKTLNCHFEYQKVDEKCPRFVSLPIALGAGLGNKFLTYILGIALAIDTKSTYIYDATPFLQTAHQNHGNYPFVEPLFKWGLNEQNISYVKEKYNPKIIDVKHKVWENITRDYKDQCGVMLEGDDFVCNFMICYYSDTPRIFEKIKSIVRCKIMQSDYQITHLYYSPETYNVAWHMRTGDSGLQTLHQGDKSYFERMKAQLDEVLEGFEVRYHFFTEAPDRGNVAPPGFEFLTGMFPGANFHNNATVESSIIHLMNADLLVTSGSSFCFVASTVSYKPVVFFEKPKEGVWGIYRDEDHVMVEGGNVIKPSLSEVRALIMYKYEAMHDHTVPPSDYFHRRTRQLR